MVVLEFEDMSRILGSAYLQDLEGGDESYLGGFKVIIIAQFLYYDLIKYRHGWIYARLVR